ncbi:MAG: hypothetical protein SWJ54_23405, partial [Cyanobacteriota bacterium]|nr:hypothetical protein [Cyanobacteriota bacterium]
RIYAIDDQNLETMEVISTFWVNLEARLSLFLKANATFARAKARTPQSTDEKKGEQASNFSVVIRSKAALVSR